MKLLSNILLAGIFAIASTFAFATTDVHAQDMPGENVVDVINNSDNHTIMSELIAEAQLTETLEQPGPFTVLAPSDDAFEPILDEINEMRNDPQQLQNVLINHLFQGEASSEEVETNFGVAVADGDIEAANGVVHSIEEVLLEQ